MRASIHGAFTEFSPAGPLLGEGGEGQGAPEDAQNWFVVSADIKNAFHQMCIPERLQAFFALPAVLASEVGCSGKRSARNVLFPIQGIPRSFNTSDGFSSAMFFC